VWLGLRTKRLRPRLLLGDRVFSPVPRRTWRQKTPEDALSSIRHRAAVTYVRRGGQLSVVRTKSMNTGARRCGTGRARSVVAVRAASRRLVTRDAAVAHRAARLRQPLATARLSISVASIPSGNDPQHGAAAAPRTAATGERALRTLAHSALILEAIVVPQFLARANRALRANEHTALIVFDRLTIRIAAVVNPSRSVPTQARIDDGAIAECKQHSVVRIRRITRRTLVGRAGR